MAELNKSTLTQKLADIIARVAPYDGNPLIQKSEIEELLDDYIDSFVSETPTQVSVSNPSPVLGIDFSQADEHSIDSVGVGSSEFLVTFSNLSGNSVGKVFITKEGSQIYDFSNANINGELIQEGVNEFRFLVFVIDGVYNILPFREFGNADYIDSDSNSSRIQVRKRVLESGTWDMDSQSLINVSHDLPSGYVVTNLTAMIYSDTLNDQGKLLTVGNDGTDGGYLSVSGGSISLIRYTGGTFDSFQYSGLAVNRALISIEYIVS